jgi:peptidoglycan hydrolase-like protein with peptidoglycan-binding domain/DNA invertase Pin-like site-specific DNA recombinase
MLSCLLARSASAAIVLMTVGVVALGAPLPAAVAATPASATVLAEGAGLGASPSTAVRRVQRILRRHGYSLGRPGVDGRFGPLTAAAVRRMQGRYGLVPDGIVGPKTRRVLDLIAAATAPRTRSGNRRSRPPRQTTTRPPAQTTPSRTTPAPRVPATQPLGRTVAPSAGGNGEPRLATVVAALAVLISLIALVSTLLRGRRTARGLQLAPIHGELYVEGESERPEVGSFRGLAVATAVPYGDEDDPRRARYLVDDPLKPAPVWVTGGDVRRSPSRLSAGEPVIGYVTAGPDPAVEHNAFIAIEMACEQAGWKLDDIVHDQDNGRLVGRPGLTSALERIAAGEARGLVVSDAGRLTQSLAGFGALLKWFREAEGVLVALDLDLDTSTVHGHRTASALIAVSGWDSERSAARARRSLARVRTPDRTAVPTAEDRATVIERIHAMRAAGMSLHAIAIQLGNEGVPPPRDVARWNTSAVKNALDTPPPGEDSMRDALPPIPTHRRR